MNEALFDLARLHVRLLRRSDAGALLAVYSDENAMRWVGDGRAITADEVQQWLDVTERNLATRGYGMCALVLRGSDARLGRAHIRPAPHHRYHRCARPACVTASCAATKTAARTKSSTGARRHSVSLSTARSRKAFADVQTAFVSSLIS